MKTTPWAILSTIAKRAHGEFGFATLDTKTAAHYVDIRRADAQAKKNGHHAGFMSMPEKDMKKFINANPELLKGKAADKLNESIDTLGATMELQKLTFSQFNYIIESDLTFEDFERDIELLTEEQLEEKWGEFWSKVGTTVKDAAGKAKEKVKKIVDTAKDSAERRRIDAINKKYAPKRSKEISTNAAIRSRIKDETAKAGQKKAGERDWRNQHGADASYREQLRGKMSAAAAGKADVDAFVRGK